jgi:hypothetical protein
MNTKSTSRGVAIALSISVTVLSFAPEISQAQSHAGRYDTSQNSSCSDPAPIITWDSASILGADASGTPFNCSLGQEFSAGTGVAGYHAKCIIEEQIFKDNVIIGPVHGGLDGSFVVTFPWGTTLEIYKCS